MDDVPSLIPPGVCLLQEEIRCHAYPEHLAASDLVFSAARFAERIAEPGLRSVDFSAVLVTLGIEVIHVAVLAALTALFAAVPGIPYVVQ